MPVQIARRAAWSGLHRFHYRFLYGRRVPGSAAIERAVRRGEVGTGRDDTPKDSERWDEQYRAGRWDYLADAEQLPRIGMLVGLLRRHAPGGAVLDVGCGAGVLADFLRPHGYRGFLGLDVSAAAIERAQRLADDRTAFLVGDAEAWAPPAGTQFDAIIFNDSVYYFQRPLETVQRLADALAPGGVLLVSSFGTPRSAAIQRQLRRALPVRDEFDIVGRDGRWTILEIDATMGRGSGSTAEG